VNKRSALLPAFGLVLLLTGCAMENSAQTEDYRERKAAWKLFEAAKRSDQDLSRQQEHAARASRKAAIKPESTIVCIWGPFAKRSGGTTFAYFQCHPYTYMVEFEQPGSARIRRAGYYTLKGEPLAGNPSNPLR